ncbi:MAG: lysine--tRNA ligase [Patescibacteria group bacterium]
MPKNTAFSHDEEQVRIKKLGALREAGIDPYPARSVRSDTLAQALERQEGEAVSVAGRIVLKREIGKLTFCHLQDASGRMQIALKKDDLKDAYSSFIKTIDTGDIISVSGVRFVTHTGEQSILVKEWSLLTKALLPLPEKWHGLQDEETRLRKRYLELLLDSEVRERFHRKAVFWNATREFLLREGFLEVETPVLETTAGGADATPFVTHHEALGIDVYLRISMGELWQKRLMVGGFEKTFEIGRQFRNEGMSREHLQDYSQMEFYLAYADYTVGMALVERLFKEVIQKTFGTLTFTIGEFSNIDLSKTWERIDYVDTVKTQTGVDVLSATESELRRALDKLGVSYEKHEGKGRLMDSLWKICRKKIAGPVFLINHPVAVSPLAKRCADNPEKTERYQVIIAGSELGNGYSELNDPIDQAERFAEQARMREAGDTEAQMHDHDFIEALKHGMPPTTGFGFSERLFAFLENKPVRECVLFPLVRPEHDEKNV